MKLSTTLMATLACTQAIQIKSEAEAEAEFNLFGFIENTFNDAKDYFEDDFVDDLDAAWEYTTSGELFDEFGNLIEEGYNYVASGDFAADLETAANATVNYVEDDFLNDLSAGTDIVGSFFEDAANTVATGAEEVWNWASDGDNWVDLGQDIGGGFEDAWEWGTEGDNWVSLGEDIIGGLEDAWDWAKDGDNWAASAGTLFGTVMALGYGEYETAEKLFTTADHYNADWHEEQKRLAKEAQEKAAKRKKDREDARKERLEK